MRIGIDLGGTKIEGILLDDYGQEKKRRRIATPTNDYDAILTTISSLVMQLEEGLPTHPSVGVGIPGAISKATGLVKNANTTVLIGHPLHLDLGRLLDRPVQIANDANCFVLSETTDGAAAGVELAFGAILGTGTGGGLVIHGHVLSGAHDIAGEWGHNPLPWPRDDERPGPACYCGKKGCIETYLSGPGLARDHSVITQQTLTPIEIARAADSGDKQALDTWDRYLDRLARSLATVINLVDPDCIVLGGGLSNVERIYRELPRRLPLYVFSDFIQTPIVQARHGDSSGVRGAAWLWSAEEQA